MSNNEENRRSILSFTRSLFHLRESRRLFRLNLGFDYRTLVDRANDHTKQILFFIECDEATDSNSDFHSRLYEAARLYKRIAEGKVYALTRHSSTSVTEHDAFTRVFSSLAEDQKIQVMMNVFRRENRIRESIFFVFGGPELLAGILNLNRRGDLLVDISGQSDEGDDDDYSMVEYILYYLTISGILQQMRREAYSLAL